MARLLTIATVVVGAFVFGRWLTSDLFSKILQPLIVALSIMAAALLVRLNRGMPTLDWKSLDSIERKILTGKIVELTKEYIFVLSIQAVTLIALLVIAVQDAAHLSTTTQTVILAFEGALVALSVSRMAYIVWRDYDIVRLQKKLIDDSADREQVDKDSKEALSKVSVIRASNVRSGGKIETKNWPE